MVCDSASALEEGSATGRSVSQWLEDLKAEGDEVAAALIWRRFAPRLLRIAQQRIGQTRRGAADEDDVVAEAFAQFFQRLKQGGFAHLADRRDLWQVLAVLTDRRAIDHLRRETRHGKKSRLVGESHFSPHEQASQGAPHSRVGGLSQIATSPAVAAEFVAEFREWLAQLEDDTLRQIAVGKLRGYTNEELAQQLQTSLRSVERKLARLRTSLEPRVNR